MSAGSVIVRGARAYLLSDAGGYHHDGTILKLTSKVVGSRRLRLAITFTGTAHDTARRDSLTWLARMPDQATAIARLPELVQSIAAANQATKDVGCGTGDLPTWVQLMVAAYSAERGEAGAFICGSDRGTFGEGYDPLSVREVRDVLSPPVDRSLCPDDGFDPIRHGRAILQAQRHMRSDLGTYVVGGWGELTTVDAKGVSTRTLCRWPDRVGEKVRP